MKKSEALRILGLANGADDDAVKVAHRKKVVENHPDKFPHGSAEYDAAEERTKLINEARDVLLSRKWEPEYSQRGPYANPYGQPYSGSPSSYTGGSGYPGQGSTGQSGNPYEAWPFSQGQTTWVWTSWDGVADQEGNPFNPFDFVRGTQKTPEELKAETTRDLRAEILMIGVKIACLGAFSLFGLLPMGLFVYVVISLGFGLWKRLKGCLAPFIIPAVLVLTPLILLIMPQSGALTDGLIIACVLAALFDIRNIRTRIAAYRNARTATNL